MALNATTCKWIKDIEPVLEINSSMYEQIKFEYEERLQATIKYVNETTERLIPMLGNSMIQFKLGFTRGVKFAIYIKPQKEFDESMYE